MSTLKATTIIPQSGTNLTLGAAGDTLTVNSDSIKINTWKDSGGNTLWSSDGAGTVTNINSYISPSWKLIATQEITSTSQIVSSIDFTGPNFSKNGGYDKYAFVVLNLRPVTNGTDFRFQPSIDGGATFRQTKTTSAFRTYNQQSGSGALAYQANEDQSGQSDPQVIAHYVGNSAGQCASGIVYMFTPSSSTYVHQFYSRFMVQDGSGTTTLNDFFAQGYFEYSTQSPPLGINGVQFNQSSGNFSGKISMYGVC